LYFYSTIIIFNVVLKKKMNKTKTKGSGVVAVKLGVISVLVLQFLYLANNIVELEKWGMDVIVQIQRIRSVPLDLLMRVGSFLGFEFFFFLVPLLAWWGNKKAQRVGISLFFFLLAIFFATSVLKVIFSRPRPISVNESLQAVVSNQLEKLEFSFPSGHAWASMSFFFLVKYSEKIVHWIGAFLASLFTVFSRIYFGVHYPHDILGGVICGIILVIAFTFVETFLEEIFTRALEQTEKKSDKKLKRGLFLNQDTLISIVLVASTLSVSLLLDETNRGRQQGLIFGPFCMLGMLLSRPFFLQLQCESTKYRVIRMFVGVPVIASVQLLYLISPQILRPLIAMLVGIMIFVVAPRIFVLLKLNK